MNWQTLDLSPTKYTIVLRFQHAILSFVQNGARSFVHRKIGQIQTPSTFRVIPHKSNSAYIIDRCDVHITFTIEVTTMKKKLSTIAAALLLSGEACAQVVKKSKTRRLRKVRIYSPSSLRRDVEFDRDVIDPYIGLPDERELRPRKEHPQPIVANLEMSMLSVSSLEMSMSTAGSLTKQSITSSYPPTSQPPTSAATTNQPTTTPSPTIEEAESQFPSTPNDTLCLQEGTCPNPNNGKCESKVECFVDPCEVNTNFCTSGVCEANHCGGCHSICVE